MKFSTRIARYTHVPCANILIFSGSHKYQLSQLKSQLNLVFKLYSNLTATTWSFSTTDITLVGTVHCLWGRRISFFHTNKIGNARSMFYTHEQITHPSTILYIKVQNILPSRFCNVGEEGFFEILD